MRHEHDWRRVPAQPPSLPGQRSLFQEIPYDRRDEVIIMGDRYLFDAGHGLPGADETDQRLLWDVK